MPDLASMSPGRRGRRYPLEHVVEAARYVETEQKTGNDVLLVGVDHAT